MLNWTNHWLEIKYRLIYWSIGAILTWIIIILNYETINQMLAPNISTWIYFGDMLEGFWQMWKLSINLTICLILPQSLLTIHEFIKPGLYKKETYPIKRIWIWQIIIPWIIYFFIMNILTEYFLTYTSEYNRYLPSLIKTTQLIISTINYSIIVSWIPYILIKGLEKGTHKEILQWIIIILLSMITPPDIIYLIGNILGVLIITESWIGWKKIIKEYKNRKTRQEKWNIEYHY